jgi:biopolymer transport protein ExbD
MKLTRTKHYHFGWLLLVPLLDIIFLLIFFVLLSANFTLQPGIAVSLPLSKFQLAPQQNQQIISITGGAIPTIYFRDQKITLEQLGPLLDLAKRDGQSIIIKADRMAPYESVVAVTNAALEHGIASVSLAGAPAPR